MVDDGRPSLSHVRGQWGNKLVFLSAIAAVFLSVSAAQPDWVVSYQNYQTALEEGDVEAAMVHAGEAWRAASIVLEPSENLALLAQNYGTKMVLTDPEAAIPALQDAVDLGEQGFGLSNLSLSSSRFQLRAAEALTKPNKQRVMNQALDAAEQLPDTEKLAIDNTTLLLRLSDQLIASERGQDARRLLNPLADLLHAVETTHFRTLASVELLRFQAVLIDKPNLREGQNNLDFGKMLASSYVGLHRASLKSTSAHSIEEIDPVAAELYTASAVIFTFFESYSISGYDEAHDLATTYGPGVPLLAGRANCSEINWARRKVEYDTIGYGRRGVWVGAVLVAGRLMRDGSMGDVRLAGATPSGLFDIGVLRDATRWKADIEGISENCFGDRTTLIMFVIDGEN